MEKGNIREREYGGEVKKWNIGVGAEYLQQRNLKEPSESDLNYSPVLYQVPRRARIGTHKRYKDSSTLR